MHSAWACPATYIRSITGVTNKKRLAIAIKQLHKLYISHSFKCIVLKGKGDTAIFKREKALGKKTKKK